MYLIIPGFCIFRYDHFLTALRTEQWDFIVWGINNKDPVQCSLGITPMYLAGSRTLESIWNANLVVGILFYFWRKDRVI